MANGNPTATAEAAGRELHEQAQRVRADLNDLGDNARRAVARWEGELRARLIRHPYAVLSAAAGVGYVLGGGVPPLLVRTLLGVVGRVAMENVLISLAAKRDQP